LLNRRDFLKCGVASVALALGGYEGHALGADGHEYDARKGMRWPDKNPFFPRFKRYYETRPKRPGINKSLRMDAELSAEKIPVLVYHSHFVLGPDYASNSNIALPLDLEVIHNAGFYVVPVKDIVDWSLGNKKRSDLPERAVGLTFDDGFDLDWNDITSSPYGELRSFRSILEEFVDRHKEQDYTHATSFVIASPKAREIISAGWLSETWWYEAQKSGLFDIMNHSTDHLHSSIREQTWDPELRIYLTTGGYGKSGEWAGHDDFSRIDNPHSARNGIALAASYIKRVTGEWPSLFAYPYGSYSEYLPDTYFPSHKNECGIDAAFKGQGYGSREYVTKGLNPWELPRFTHGYNWTDPTRLKEDILEGSL
jgi:hypothetical protein